MNKRRGQVWIETVTYTLVAFVLIGLVLSFAKPKIESLQDQAILEQSLKILKQLDLKINEVSDYGSGNKRKVELELKKGEILFNSTNNSLKFTLDGKFMYSEPGQKYNEGDFEILTTERGKDYIVTIEKKYSNLNFTYNDKEEDKIIPRSASPYTIFITNNGGLIENIDFTIE